MIIVTLFNIEASFGLLPNEEPFEPYRITKTKPKFIFTHPRYNRYMEEHYTSSENVSAHKHITFLTYWLPRSIFYSNSIQVGKKYVPLATQLHEKREVCLRKLIFYGIYESFGFTSRDLKER